MRPPGRDAEKTQDRSTFEDPFTLALCEGLRRVVGSEDLRLMASLFRGPVPRLVEDRTLAPERTQGS
jgi:hypothetical protein